MKYYAIYTLGEDNRSCVLNILYDYSHVDYFCKMFSDENEVLYIHEFETPEKVTDFYNLLCNLEAKIDDKGEHKKYEKL